METFCHKSLVIWCFRTLVLKSIIPQHSWGEKYLWHTHQHTHIHLTILLWCDLTFFLLFIHKRLRKEVLLSYFSFDVFADLLVHEKIYRLNQYHTKARTHIKRDASSNVVCCPRCCCIIYQPHYQVCCIQSIICNPHNHNQFSASKPSIFFPSSREKSICNLS